MACPRPARDTHSLPGRERFCKYNPRWLFHKTKTLVHGETRNCTILFIRQQGLESREANVPDADGNPLNPVRSHRVLSMVEPFDAQSQQNPEKHSQERVFQA